MKLNITSHLFAFIIFITCMLSPKVSAFQWIPVKKIKPTIPVIFIPDREASAPIRSRLDPDLYDTGLPAKKLILDPFYDPFIETLKFAGYKEGKTLFRAVYDWRMMLAPNANEIDDLLENITAETITRGDFSATINYLGYWLDKAVRANPETEFVDIVTHGRGAFIALAYIQSPAYGAAYYDKYGIQRHLPKVRFLILVEEPNFETIDFENSESAFAVVEVFENDLFIIHVRSGSAFDIAEEDVFRAREAEFLGFQDDLFFDQELAFFVTSILVGRKIHQELPINELSRWRRKFDPFVMLP